LAKKEDEDQSRSCKLRFRDHFFRDLRYIEFLGENGLIKILKNVPNRPFSMAKRRYYGWLYIEKGKVGILILPFFRVWGDIIPKSSIDHGYLRHGIDSTKDGPGKDCEPRVIRLSVNRARR
jgi:hypothetical protein